MTLTITIDMDNAAFEDDTEGECARILKDLAEKIDKGFGPTEYGNVTLRDVNGNTVGKAEVR
jgi:hypothetical protein